VQIQPLNYASLSRKKQSIIVVMWIILPFPKYIYYYLLKSIVFHVLSDITLKK